MAVFASLEFLGVQEAYIRCEIESMVPEKRGMGSSAGESIGSTCFGGYSTESWYKDF